MDEPRSGRGFYLSLQLQIFGSVACAVRRGGELQEIALFFFFSLRLFFLFFHFHFFHSLVCFHKNEGS